MEASNLIIQRSPDLFLVTVTKKGGGGEGEIYIYIYPDIDNEIPEDRSILNTQNDVCIKQT
jgi:hypothetical protein